MRADTPFSRMPACLMDPASLKRHSKPPLHPTLAGWFSVVTCEDICFRYGKYLSSRAVFMQKPCHASFYGNKTLAVSFRFSYGKAIQGKIYIIHF